MRARVTHNTPGGVTDCTTPGGANRPPGGADPGGPYAPRTPGAPASTTTRRHREHDAHPARPTSPPTTSGPAGTPQRHTRTAPTRPTASASTCQQPPQHDERTPPRSEQHAPAPPPGHPLPCARRRTRTRPPGTTGDTTPDPDTSTVTPGGTPCPGSPVARRDAADSGVYGFRRSPRWSFLRASGPPSRRTGSSMAWCARRRLLARPTTDHLRFRRSQSQIVTRKGRRP